MYHNSMSSPSTSSIDLSFNIRKPPVMFSSLSSKLSYNSNKLKVSPPSQSQIPSNSYQPKDLIICLTLRKITQSIWTKEKKFTFYLIRSLFIESKRIPMIKKVKTHRRIATGEPRGKSPIQIFKKRKNEDLVRIFRNLKGKYLKKKIIFRWFKHIKLQKIRKKEKLEFCKMVFMRSLVKIWKQFRKNSQIEWEKKKSLIRFVKILKKHYTSAFKETWITIKNLKHQDFISKERVYIHKPKILPTIAIKGKVSDVTTQTIKKDPKKIFNPKKNLNKNRYQYIHIGPIMRVILNNIYKTKSQAFCIIKDTYRSQKLLKMNFLLCSLCNSFSLSLKYSAYTLLKTLYLNIKLIENTRILASSLNNILIHYKYLYKFHAFHKILSHSWTRVRISKISKVAKHKLMKILKKRALRLLQEGFWIWEETIQGILFESVSNNYKMNNIKATDRSLSYDEYSAQYSTRSTRKPTWNSESYKILPPPHDIHDYIDDIVQITTERANNECFVYKNRLRRMIK
ncbi:hypothetical protein SteCoe_7115 [Stentor coeruleus]|uniref:Uncharacterized protein n=1 Tax=Stentor coeruleus TaxID=5963 RepID=A0A1R2CNI5_9CILI|nr:hypothetical protein SteCoe_7115 [Stentor coeruleus]